MSKKTRKKSTKSPAKRPAAKTAAKKLAQPKTTVRKTSKSKAARTAAVKATRPAVRKASSLSEGMSAPSFNLPRDGGSSVSLKDYSGRKLAIFFYPRADTPGCTREAMDFSRLAKSFAACQTVVLGVSADPVSAQESFRDKHQLSVPLVSDEKQTMLKAYGVWGEKSMYGKTFMGIVRTTVLVGSNGKITRIWRNVKVDGHADEVLAAAQAL